MEIQINRALQDEMVFENEKGHDVVQEIVYEWKPVQCQSCQMFGHIREKCRKSAKTVQK